MSSALYRRVVQISLTVRFRWLVALFCVFAAGFSLSYYLRATAQKLDGGPSGNLAWQSESARVRVNESYGKLPLAFEPNQGQASRETQFLSRGTNYKLLLRPEGAELSLHKRESELREAENRSIKPSRTNNRRSTTSTIRMSLVGSSTTATGEPQGELPTKSNYLIGSDTTKWRTGIPNYSQVRYEQIYPGIAIVYYGSQNRLEYDFQIDPGANPQDIRLKFSGMNRMEIDKSGDLVLHLSDGDVKQSRPVVYQETESGRRDVGGNYILKSEDEVGFQVGDYDKTKPLVIDPILAYATYLNFYATAVNGGIAVDNAGNVYVTGSDGESVYVAKLNPQGTAFVYTTLIGGTNGDTGQGIAVDANGNAYVSGNAYSNDFPVVNAFQPVRASEAINVADSFVFKLNPAGTNLLFSTFLGGTEEESNFGIALDAAGNVLVAGAADSTFFQGPPDTPFPTVNAYQSTSQGGVDGYLAKFNATGGMVYSTLLGGESDDYALDVAVDSDGAAYLTGFTTSTDFPVQNPLQPTLTGDSADIFITKFNATGASLAYSTYLGGAGDDLGWGIALDSSRNIYVTGFTRSQDFPTTSPFQAANAGTGRDAFITKVNTNGTALVYSTYLGGAFAEEASDIFVNAESEVTVVGWTSSLNFPLMNPLQSSVNNGTDAFITKFNSAGAALVYSTYLGGTDGSDYGNGVVIDASGNTYVFGETYSNNFPTVNPLQPTLNDFRGGFLAKLNESGNETFYTISGIIESNVGNRLGGVTVTLSGSANAVVISDAIGYYSFSGLPSGGTYTVTPTRAGMTFDPPSQSFANLQANQTADFMQAPRSYHIGGRVTDSSGNGIPNVSVEILGYFYPIERTTDADGSYLLMYLAGNRDYTVKARHSDYSFTPLSYSFTLTSNLLETNFTGTNNTGLSISLTSPANGATFQAPANITVSANAASSNSTVNKVEFFAGGNLIGTDTTAPYSVDWNNVAGGVYSISAIVTDNAGATKTSSAVSIIVNSVNGPTVAITSPIDGATLYSGRYISISANASSSNGSITKVDFYQGAQVIGSDTTGNPFVISYYLYAGSYVFTAVATDSTGAIAQSSQVHLTVVNNQYPSVALTSPPNNSVFPIGANINLTADASDADGTIVSVAFFVGSTHLGTDTTAPYASAWNNAASGIHALIAMATDSEGAVSFSHPVDIQVGNRAPSAYITSPSSGTQYAAPANINITATGFDQDGTITQAEFFASGNLIGTDTSAPYSMDWTNVSAGNYDIIVKVTDNEGAIGYSSYVSVRVFENVPTVSVVEPLNGATFVSPATITVTANATSINSTISYLSFYAGSQHLGFDSNPPYSITWSNVPAGTYAITAVATDALFAETTSAPVSVTVTGNIGNWKLQVPAIPATGSFGVNDVDMISATEGWAVTDSFVYHTTDGGLTWQPQDSGTTEPLNAISFFDAQHGMAIGNVVIYTTNGGLTWQQGAGSLGSFYGIDHVDTNTGYACGGGGSVLKTTNGGANWVPIPTPVFTNPNLIGIDFVDANTGWTVGANGTIIATANGGSSWTIQNSNTTGYFGGVSFVNANEGWAVAGNVIVHTANGGQTWEQQTVPANTWAYDVHFIDSQNGTAVGSQENIIHTSNGGQTWTTQRGGNGSGFGQPLWSVNFGDAMNGVAVGGTTVLRTTDGGVTWNEPANNYLSASNKVFATDEMHAWSANADAEVLYTIDGGINWNRSTLFTPTANSQITDITFIDNQNGWATASEGPPGLIYKTTNGGQTWQNAGAPQSAALNGIAIVDAQTLVAVGNAGTILRSTNGGASWSVVTSPVSIHLKDVHFVDATAGWIVAGGFILKSINGGQTWVEQTSGLEETADLKSVSFADANNGWAAGWGDLLHTIDGGQTWVAQTADSGANYEEVQAISSTLAWVCGSRIFGTYSGYVAQTTDGGQSWARDNLDTGAQLTSCFFLDENTGWVGGSSFQSMPNAGRIYHRTGSTPTVSPLTVTLTSPANGATFNGTPITIMADASNNDGTITQLDFYDGATLIGTDTTAPYSFVWNNANVGNHTITARATANLRGTNATSFTDPVTVNVITAINAPPSVSLTSPTSNATFNVGAGIPLAATAEDVDGLVNRVEIYAGATLIATDMAAPYQSVWIGAPEGTHVITAVAFDNAGASTTSTAISITVNQGAVGSTVADFDGDGKTDVSVFRPSDGNWYLTNSSDNVFRAEHFGASGDVVAPGDYDGDGKTDIAVFRPSNGYWYILNSSDRNVRSTQFGQAGDVPATGDFDGDGKSDIAVFRASVGTFYMLNSSDGSFQFKQWGADGDIPVMGDYDGDARTDFAIFRPSIGTFYILSSSDGSIRGEQFGQNGDKPIAGYFDADVRSDIAVFRPSTGGWYVRNSSDNSFNGIAWGASGDLATPGDYDGDGRWDVAVFRPSTGVFYILQSTSNSLRAEQFGTSGDVPAASAYVR